MVRVGELPSRLPSPSLPDVEDDLWLDLALKAIPLGLLAGAESLLSSQAIDRMAPTMRKHNANLELFGQGIANTVVGFFAGLPVSGVVVRSGVNVQSGARTRVSSILHAALLVLSVLYLSRFIRHVPIAALAGLLVVVGGRLLEVRELLHLAQTSKLEALAFVVTAAGTVSGNLMSGMAVGLVIAAAHRYLNRGAEAQKKEVESAKAIGARAVLKGARAVLKGAEIEGRKPAHWQAQPEETHKWVNNLRGRQMRASTAYVHEQASVVGQVVMGEHVHVAAGSSVRADEGTPFFIGPNTNLQDGVVLHALKDKHVLVAGEPWAIYIGKNVSLAHNAMVHGPCYVGDGTFIGFKAVVHDSVVGAGCFIGHGAIVVGVEIPDGRLVPNGRIVDSADAVAALPMAGHQHHEFNEDVVEVNRGLAVAYHQEQGPQTKASNLAHGPQPTASIHMDVRSVAAWDEAWSPSVEKERF
jgi:sulfate permease, SulP family